MRMIDIINRYGVITIFIFFLFVYTYVGKKMRDEAVDPLKKGGFYWGISSENDYINEPDNIISYVVLFIVVSLAVWILGLALPDQVAKSVNDKFINFIFDQPLTMLATYVTLVTFLGIFVNWNSKKFIAFSLEEFLYSYKLIFKMKYMILLIVCAYINLFLADLQWKIRSISVAFFVVLLCDVIFFLGTFFSVLWIILDLLLGYNIEKHMLNNLYRKFWYKSFQHSDIKWKDKIVVGQMNYLYDRFSFYFKKIQSKDLKGLSFDTNFRISNSERFKRLKGRSLVMVLVFSFFISFVSSGVACIVKGQFKNYLGWYFLYAVIAFIMDVFTIGLPTVFIGIIYDRKGYEFEIKCGKRLSYRYVSDTSLFPQNMYSKFVRSVKNIVAYFALAFYEEKYEAINEMIQECQQRDKDGTAMLVMIIVDYLYNQEGQVESLVISKSDKAKYGKYAKSFIVDIGALKQDDTIDCEDIDNYLNNVGKWAGNASSDTIQGARCKR